MLPAFSACRFSSTFCFFSAVSGSPHMWARITLFRCIRVCVCVGFIRGDDQPRKSGGVRNSSTRKKGDDRRLEDASMSDAPQLVVCACVCVCVCVGAGHSLRSRASRSRAAAASTESTREKGRNSNGKAAHEGVSLESTALLDSVFVACDNVICSSVVADLYVCGGRRQAVGGQPFSSPIAFILPASDTRSPVKPYGNSPESSRALRACLAPPLRGIFSCDWE